MEVEKGPDQDCGEESGENEQHIRKRSIPSPHFISEPRKNDRKSEQNEDGAHRRPASAVQPSPVSSSRTVRSSSGGR